MGAVALLILSLAGTARAEVAQDPKALAALTRKALRLGERTVVPTAQSAAFGELAEANLPAGTRPLEGGTLRSFQQKKGEDGFEGNMLGFVMETAMQPAMRQMDLALSSATAGTAAQTLSLAGLPAHTLALALQKPSPNAARAFYVLVDKPGLTAKALRLVFRVTESRPGSMSWKKGAYDHELGTSASCWYVAEPDGRLRDSIRSGDDGNCLGFCEELQAWTGAGCLEHRRE